MAKVKKHAKKHARKKATPKKPTLALARREPERHSISLLDPKALMPSAQPMAVTRQIGQGITLLGDLGLVESKLSPEEVAVINRPIDISRIRFKPQKKGPPIPFLPHYEYTKWFNEAFGHGGWALVPADTPKLTNGTVSRDYVLYIHGKPRSFAVGEQDYFENNAQQTYGDALESTMSSALRRCAKHLGFGLELWDKDYMDEVREKRGVTRQRAGDQEAEPSSHQSTNRPPAAVRHAHQNQPISENQYGRLLAIIKAAGRTKSEVLAYLNAFYGIKTWDAVKTSIKRTDYDAICAAVEKRGRFPVKLDATTPVRTPDAVLEASDIPWGDEQ